MAVIIKSCFALKKRRSGFFDSKNAVVQNCLKYHETSPLAGWQTKLMFSLIG